MNSIAFAADANLWCPKCAEERYHGCGEQDVLDREGNIVTPIFSTSSDASLQVCTSCGEELDPPPAKIDEEVKFLMRQGFLDANSPTELIERAYEMRRQRDNQDDYDDAQDALNHLLAFVAAIVRNNRLYKRLNELAEEYYDSTFVGMVLPDQIELLRKFTRGDIGRTE